MAGNSSGVTLVSIGRPGQTSYHGQQTGPGTVDLPDAMWKVHDLTLDFYYHTDDWRDIDSEPVGLQEKLEYRAERRNVAVKIAIEKYPDTRRIVMCDSFYLSQWSELHHLIMRHTGQLEEMCTIGPAVWGRMRTNLNQIASYHMGRQRFYDAWTTPELRWCPRGWKPEHDILTGQELVPLRGLYRVSSVGGCYIFPVNVWEKGARYCVPSDLHGCEHNGFHASYSLPKYVDFNVEMYRVKKYGLAHCARCSIGNWRRTRFA